MKKPHLLRSFSIRSLLVLITGAGLMAWFSAEPSPERFYGGCGILCVFGVCVARNPFTDSIRIALMLGFIWGTIPLVFYVWPVTVFRVLTGYREQGELYDENGPGAFFAWVVIMTWLSLPGSCFVSLAVGAVVKSLTKAVEEISHLIKRD